MTHLSRLFSTSLILAASTLAAQADPLIYSTFLPAQHGDVAHVMPSMSERMSSRTQGRVSFNIQSGGVLAGPAVALESIGDGIIDSGLVFYGYTPQLVPAITMIGDMPGTSVPVAAAAATETMLLNCPQCAEEMEEMGVIGFTNGTSDPYNLYCAKAEIRELSDLQGLKVRASGGFAQLIASLGGTPVNLVITEMYAALQRGQVDCAIAAVSMGNDVQLWDVAKTVPANLALGTLSGHSEQLINRDVWDGLSSEDRQIWLEETAQMQADHLRSNMSHGLAATHAERGLTVTEASPALLAKLEEARMALRETILRVAAERGVRDPQAILAAYDASYAKWQKISDGIGQDKVWGDAEWSAYADQLTSEIYSKLKID